MQGLVVWYNPLCPVHDAGIGRQKSAQAILVRAPYAWPCGGKPNVCSNRLA